MSLILTGNSSSLTIDSTNEITYPNATVGTVGNGPAFLAYQSTNQSAAGLFKVTLDTEIFDTNGNFASSRFTPTIAGYYQINFTVGIATTNTSYFVYGMLYKNGSEYYRGSSVFAASANYPSSSGSMVLYMNGSTDYVELYGYSNSSGVNTYAYQPLNNMSGALIRGA